MLISLLFCLIYFLPTVVAVRRGQPFGGVLILNLLFGWTVIGWAALLLWTMLRTPRLVYVTYAAQPHPPIDYRF